MQRILDKLPFAQSTWFLYLSFLIRHYWGDDCPQKSASLTYTTLLSLVPIITVILVVLSGVDGLQDAKTHLKSLIYANILPTSSQSVRTYLESFTDKSTNLGLFGIAGIFITTMMTLLTIENTFNQIWRVHNRTNFIDSLVRYWTMMTLTPIVLGVAFGASSAIRGFSLFNQKFMGYGIDWEIWAQIASLFVMTAGFIGMYWFIPKTQVPLKNALKAGVVVAVLFELLKHTFGALMSNFTSYEAIYGAFAIIPVFLMWLYLSWNVILLGVEISYTLTIFDAKDKATVHPLLNHLNILHLAYQRYQEGQAVNESEMRALLGRKERPNWHIYLSELLDNKLLTHTQNGNYVLRMDLDSVNLWQFYKQLPHPLPTTEELNAYARQHDAVWIDKLHHRLACIQTTAKGELGLSLAQLFKDKTDNEPTATPPASEPTPTEQTWQKAMTDWVSKSKKWFKKPK